MLSLLCVTRFEPHAVPFVRSLKRVAIKVGGELVLAFDERVPARGVPTDLAPDVRGTVRSIGYIESVLDDALALCTGDYILRLDDDERCSPAMVQWLHDSKYREHPHWKFPRVHLWPDTRTVLLSAQLWPDHQTRLSVPAMSGGRQMVHAGSPYGGGQEAPVAIEHHKFIVKTVDQRREVADRYDRVCEGYGTGNMAAFSLPEVAYADQDVEIGSYGDGSVPLQHAWRRTVSMTGQSIGWPL